eukprot:Gregarina_sp_Poly_1__3409@NODE_198_length_11566_cov_244_091399_g177_i0_p7_GENE_NODE_198_length_11566_cov_244_091399_g177_i0NODE_198_length_11566_cov_244_091399_g177_i0_p7_ORF_typecomplete_len357_score38_24KAR9/PF08580_10/5_8_NODE_198_length_11566_cov_244_091399_g177_i049285998
MHVIKNIVTMEDDPASEVGGPSPMNAPEISSPPAGSHHLSPALPGTPGIMPSVNPTPSPGAPSPSSRFSASPAHTQSVHTTGAASPSPGSAPSPTSQGRPWTTRPANDPSRAAVELADHSRATELDNTSRAEVQSDFSESPAVVISPRTRAKMDEEEQKRRQEQKARIEEKESAARWVSHLNREGAKKFDQGLVVQPEEDEGGRKLDEIFSAKEPDEIPEEFPTTNRNCRGPCHPLCHIRPVRAATRSNQLSLDNPFSNFWYQEISSQRTDCIDVPATRAASTKLYHQFNGNIISGHSGFDSEQGSCSVCKHKEPPRNPPFGRECCTPTWTFPRLAKYTNARAPELYIDDLDKTSS